MPGRTTTAIEYIVALAVAMESAPAHAGGSAAQVRVESLSAEGTSYTLVVQPTANAENDPYMGGCTHFTVRGTYTYLNGALFKQPPTLSKELHMQALDFLAAAAQEHTVIRLGWVGTGFVAPDPRNRCVVASRALRLVTDLHGAAVYSFYNAL
jgi:hypothetical protein